MKNPPSSLLLIRGLATAALTFASLLPSYAQGPGRGQGQGPGQGQGQGQGAGRGAGMGGFQDAIHKLSDNHEKIKRTVEMTEDGYKSRAVSDDPEVAKTLQKHVRKMRENLGAGLMIKSE